MHVGVWSGGEKVCYAVENGRAVKGVAGKARGPREKTKRDYSEEELAAMPLKELERLLPEKQRAFVHAYILQRNGTQAAISAGYKPGRDNRTASTTASRLLKDPVITAYRLAVQKQAFSRLGITLESVCMDLVEIKERCMQARPVMEWDSSRHEYVESGEWTFDARGAIRATAELAELLGLKEQAGRKKETVRVELVAAEQFAE